MKACSVKRANNRRTSERGKLTRSCAFQLPELRPKRRFLESESLFFLTKSAPSEYPAGLEYTGHIVVPKMGKQSAAIEAKNEPILCIKLRR